LPYSFSIPISFPALDVAIILKIISGTISTTPTELSKDSLGWNHNKLAKKLHIQNISKKLHIQNTDPQTQEKN